MTGAAGRQDTYGSALTAQPGESQRRPATNASSQLIEYIGLPAFRAPGASVPDGRTIRLNHGGPSGTSAPAILIPVTNPIESVFATVRHRTVRTKGALSPTTAKLMVFKLVMAAARTWRRLKGESLLPKVVAGVTFKDGTEVVDVPADRAA